MQKFSGFLLAIVVAGIVSACSSSPSPILPPTKLTSIKDEFTLNELWYRQVGEGVSDRYYLLTPVIHNNAIYIIDYNGHLSVINPNTSDVLWEKNLGITVSAGLAKIDNVLLLASSEGDVVALDINDGKQLWKSRVSSEVLAKPVKAGNYVIVKSVDGKITALDFTTGKSKWVYDRSVPVLTLRGNSGLIVHDNTIITGLDNGKLLALSVDTGQVIWTLAVAVPRGRTEIERMIDIDATPVIYKDNLYAVSYQGRITNVHLPTGQIIWNRDFSAYHGMALSKDRLFISDSDGYVWALDLKTGATIWKQDKLVRRSLTRPVIHNGAVLVADFNGFVHWMDMNDGHFIARFRQGNDDSNKETEDDFIFSKSNGILIPPVIYQDKYFIFDRHGNISKLAVKH